jgi:hypothetical protein
MGRCLRGPTNERSRINKSEPEEKEGPRLNLTFDNLQMHVLTRTSRAVF